MSWGRITLVFVGSMIGAGFASGKEAWQFFGVFGDLGLPGIAVAVMTYAFLGSINVYIAHRLNSADIGQIICPWENKAARRVVGAVMCGFLLVAYVAMVAAGGALGESSFGLPNQAGSLVYMLLAVFTALGGFETVAARVGRIAPVLVGATLVMGLYILGRDGNLIGAGPAQEASRFASNWMFAAIAYVGYNMTAAVPVLGQCALRAGSLRDARKGVLLASFLLGLCSLILYGVTRTDPALSAIQSLPMLSFVGEYFPALQQGYAVFLLAAIFSAAATCFYGFTAKLGPVSHRRTIIWAVGIAGYGLSLYGFSNFVANVYPLVGTVSLIFFGMEILHFFRLIRKGKGQGGA